MQHKTFQCAPQSILSSHPVLPHLGDQRIRKRSRKPSNKITLPKAPDHSAWGVLDPNENVLPTSDSDSEEEMMVHVGVIDELKANRGGSGGGGAHAVKKRRHLANEDLGRFAKMSIDRDATTLSPSSVLLPPTPMVAPAASPFFNTKGLKEISATSIEEPEEEEDIAMRAKRGPIIHQIDNNRFFVSSLSDDSSDEEDKEEKARLDQIDATLQSGHLQEQEDGNFKVNGELINRLQAMESQRRRALHRDQALQRRRERGKQSDESGSNTPTTNRHDKNALILWRKPENFLLEFGIPSASTSPPESSSPVVLEEGGYAYVHRPGNLSPSGIPSSPSQSHQRGENDMELDDD